MGKSNPITKVLSLVGLAPEAPKIPEPQKSPDSAEVVKPEENSAQSYDQARERAKAAHARTNRLKFIVPLGTSKGSGGGIQIR